MYFDYGWAEDDEVTIELPAGWELDQPVAPGNKTFGDAGEYMVDVLKTTDGRKLIYRRRFDWGRKKMILMPVDAYPQIKKIFDTVQEEDSYTISLKAAVSAN